MSAKKKSDDIRFRAFTQEDGHFEFIVTGEEWHKELPEMVGCYMRPIREYKFLAAFKKASQITKFPILSYGFVNFKDSL